MSTASQCQEEKQAKRVSIDFSLDAYEQLEGLRGKRQSFNTHAGIMREALRLLIWVVEEQENGYTVASYKETASQLRIKEIVI